MLGKYDFFWTTMALCDWTQEGNDDAVLRPVIHFLSERDDAAIFAFDDLMSELLYQLDTKKLAEQCREADLLMSDDSFLYSRCVALINGPAYYQRVKRGREKGVWRMEFESLLYVPQKAWARKRHRSPQDYPHTPPFSYETGSNRSAWQYPPQKNKRRNPHEG